MHILINRNLGLIGKKFGGFEEFIKLDFTINILYSLLLTKKFHNLQTLSFTDTLYIEF